MNLQVYRIRPEFPSFRHLQLNDLNEVTNFISLFPPYSDFNTASIWSFNIFEDFEISFLNSNLIIKMRDYIDNSFFYTFIGENQVLTTASILTRYIESQQSQPMIRLVPEFMVLSSPDLYSSFEIQEDKDNFDYILDTSMISTFAGRKYLSQRNQVNKFLHSYPAVSIESKYLRDIDKAEIIKLFKDWERLSNKTEIETEHEFIALNRLLSFSNCFNLKLVKVKINNNLIGFIIYELLSGEYSIAHFMKGDLNYLGIYQVLYKFAAKDLNTMGYKYLNIEQDLGIQGLRFTKQQLNPCGFLKKYTLTKKNIS